MESLCISMQYELVTYRRLPKRQESEAIFLHRNEPIPSAIVSDISLYIYNSTLLS